MFEIFLPVVKIHVNYIYILLLSGSIGIVGGIIGIGGGFLMTPVLIFLGIPPSFAIANGSNNILASSVSGTLNSWYKKELDLKMGYFILIGAFFGVTFGTLVFKILIRIGIVDEITAVLFFLLLTSFGVLMLTESIIEIYNRKNKRIILKKRNKHSWIHGLPFKVRMPTSRLYTSIIPPIFFGFLAGIVSALLGIGGAFLLIPAMIYVIRVPIKIVRGTALLVVVFTMAFSTFFHSMANRNIDLILIVLLMVGSIIGVQIGTRITNKLRNEELKFLMSILIIMFGLKFGKSLFFAEKKVRFLRKIEIDNQFPALNNFITNFLYNHKIIYSTTAIGLALLFGFLGSFLFRKINKK
jgi:uncharacterized membrane protein YfcA